MSSKPSSGDSRSLLWALLLPLRIITRSAKLAKRIFWIPFSVYGAGFSFIYYVLTGSVYMLSSILSLGYSTYQGVREERLHKKRIPENTRQPSLTDTTTESNSNSKGTIDEDLRQESESSFEYREEELEKLTLNTEDFNDNDDNDSDLILQAFGEAENQNQDIEIIKPLPMVHEKDVAQFQDTDLSENNNTFVNEADANVETHIQHFQRADQMLQDQDDSSYSFFDDKTYAYDDEISNTTRHIDEQGGSMFLPNLGLENNVQQSEMVSSGNVQSDSYVYVSDDGNDITQCHRTPENEQLEKEETDFENNNMALDESSILKSDKLPKNEDSQNLDSILQFVGCAGDEVVSTDENGSNEKDSNNAAVGSGQETGLGKENVLQGAVELREETENTLESTGEYATSNGNQEKQFDKENGEGTEHLEPETSVKTNKEGKINHKKLSRKMRGRQKTQN